MKQILKSVSVSRLSIALVVALASAPGVAQETATSKPGWTFNPDTGWVYTRGDTQLTVWGFAERAIDPDGPDYFRRVRQGLEFDLPRLSDRLRPAVVYEVDLTNTNFFGDFDGSGGRVGRRNFENLFIALQDPDDPGRFRVLVGENTHILSREDNLSSGNLPTVNRSLILEEHGSVNSFGSQFGIQAQKKLSDTLSVQVAAMDNRGSLNSNDPSHRIGNSLSGKVLLTPLQTQDRKLTVGAAVDHTQDIQDRTFTLATAIGGAPLGGAPATGDKLTGEADIAYTFPLGGRPTTLEGEVIASRFSATDTQVAGGYAMLQHSLFETSRGGDLDAFLRFDTVQLSTAAVAGQARQSAWRFGLNYNIPHSRKLANLHLEYADNRVTGPSALVTDRSPGREVRLVLRMSLQQYVRH